MKQTLQLRRIQTRTYFTIELYKFDELLVLIA